MAILSTPRFIMHSKALSDIEDVWRWKTREKLFTTMRQFGHYVEERVGPDDNTYDFAQWYEDAASCMMVVHASGKTLFARKADSRKRKRKRCRMPLRPK